MLITLTSPWRSGRMWTALTFLVLNLFAWVGFSLVLTLVSLAFGLIVLYPIATPFIWLGFQLTAYLSVLERGRVEALLGRRIERPVLPRVDGSWWRRINHQLESGQRWLEVAYMLLLPFFGGLFAAVVIGLWGASLLLVALPVFVNALPGGSADFGLFHVSFGLGSIALCLLGIFGVVVISPWLTVGLGRLSELIAVSMLGQSEEARLRAEVASLKVSRGAALNSAEAERQRIERDLHDGAQQRLVSLAMELGRAEGQFDENPEGARELLSKARDEAANALTELRDLIRGVHPAILSDRGLDAALSSVIARSPIPVTLNVKVAERPPSTIESTAYFIVTESLTNIVKHAEATRIRVDIERNGDRLVISINDNGKGGADPTRGSGLRGLQDRVTGVGGWMQVLSPQGGPTSVIVELPCES